MLTRLLLSHPVQWKVVTRRLPLFLPHLCPDGYVVVVRGRRAVLGGPVGGDLHVDRGQVSPALQQEVERFRRGSQGSLK